MEEWKNLTESKCSELRGRTSSGYSTAIDHRQNILQNQQLKIATNNYFCTTITKVHAEYINTDDIVLLERLYFK